ncbi:hypothetical protein LTR67_000049 [Exophiala xenobiotica]
MAKATASESLLPDTGQHGSTIRIEAPSIRGDQPKTHQRGLSCFRGHKAFPSGKESVNGDITQSNNWDQPVFLTLDDLVLTLEDPAVSGQLRENMGSHTTLAQHQGRQLDISCVRLNVTLRFKKGLKFETSTLALEPN